MCGYTGYTLVLGSYLPSVDGKLGPRTELRQTRAFDNARCKKTTLMVCGSSTEVISKHNPLSRAGRLRGRGVSVEFVSIDRFDLETEVRTYLELAGRYELAEPTIIGGSYEAEHVRLVAEYYFGTEMARSIKFIATPGDRGMLKRLVVEPLWYAKYLPKVWLRRIHAALQEAFGKTAA